MVGAFVLCDIGADGDNEISAATGIARSVIADLEAGRIGSHSVAF